MKIDHKILIKQFDRFRSLNYFSQDEAVQQELKDALSSAPSEIVMTAFVNHWLETQTERPTPADIYRGIREQVEKSYVEELRPDPDCARCNGEGFEHFERDGISYSGRRCTCWARRPAAKMPHVDIQAEPATRAPRSAFSRAGESATKDIISRLAGVEPE